MTSVVSPTIRRFVDAAALADAVAVEVVERIGQAIAERGDCRLAVAGGSTPRPVYERLAEPGLAERVDWTRTHLFWGDERAVPPNHEKSNYRMVDETLLRHIRIPKANVQRIAGELDAGAAARQYAETLGEKPLDLVLLGMGGDGHTASLFPGTSALAQTTSRVLSTKSPVPPIDRVSLSLRALNEARTVLFMVAGASKADRLAEVLHQITTGSPSLPAAMVQPRSGALLWLVDASAAARL